ncbi:MAG: hypothetical protein IT388_12220 [Nitrospirales bacterium]|nr:hypothetical protein [Nitrospirales bacterium]
MFFERNCLPADYGIAEERNLTVRIRDRVRFFLGEYSITDLEDHQRVLRTFGACLHFPERFPMKVSGMTIPVGKGRLVTAVNGNYTGIHKGAAVWREIAHLLLGHCRRGVVVTFDSPVTATDYISWIFVVEMINALSGGVDRD